jgi:hypothetical protein
VKNNGHFSSIFSLKNLKCSISGRLFYCFLMGAQARNARLEFLAFDPIAGTLKEAQRIIYACGKSPNIPMILRKNSETSGGHMIMFVLLPGLLRQITPDFDTNFMAAGKRTGKTCPKKNLGH